MLGVPRLERLNRLEGFDEGGYISPGRMGGEMPSYSAVERANEGRSNSIKVDYSVTEINSVRYVSEDQFRAGMEQAASRGAAEGHKRVMSDFRHKPSARRGAGV